MPAPKSRAVRRRELGSRLRSLRTASGLSSQQVADSLGVSRWKIGRLETGVKARMERQHLLRAPEPPAFTAVLDESVLHRVVESPAVMLAQLRKLLETSRLPHVNIRVVPFDAGVVPAGVNKFVILRFVKSDIADVVLLENLTDHHLGTSNDVETYSSIFQKL